MKTKSDRPSEPPKDAPKDVQVTDAPKVTFLQDPDVLLWAAQAKTSPAFPDLPCEKTGEKRSVTARTYVGTFNRQHFHPDTGQNLRFAHVQLEAASEEDAKELLWDAFGKAWWDVHLLEDVRDQLERRRRPYFRVSWPTPDPHVGETVTLRVRLTEAQAAQSIVWLAGRCLVHRPEPNCIVLYGAGVWPEDGEYPDAWRNWQTEAGVLGAGLALHVRYVPLADAERAAAADPENVSIVEGTRSLGTFRAPRYARLHKPTLTGTFTLEALDALVRADPAYGSIRNAAERAVEATGEDERAYEVEIRDGRVVAVHVKTKSVW